MSRRPSWWLHVLAVIWPVTWLSARATRLPVVGRLVAAAALPFFSKKNLNVSYIPINREVQGAGSSFLPRQIVEEILRRASHRVIINRCTCRDDRKCREHPVTYGCTLVGDGAAEIDPRIARHVSAEEAIQHLDRTLADGLIPMVGRVKLDNLIWGVKDRGRLLTICHCCRCCCTILNSGKYLPDQAAASIKRLAGFTMQVDAERCVACGTCAATCFMGAIAVDGHARIDESKCKGCGQCATACPHGAITPRVADVEAAIAEIHGRINANINYT
jgi:ferredoxin